MTSCLPLRDRSGPTVWWEEGARREVRPLFHPALDDAN